MKGTKLYEQGTGDWMRVDPIIRENIAVVSIVVEEDGGECGVWLGMTELLTLIQELNNIKENLNAHTLPN